MNRLKEHKGISLLLRYKKEMLRRMDCLLDLDYHYMVLRRDYGNRFVITEFLQKALSIVVVSFNRFIKDACTISASALTFYSILSFIPLMALAFALAPARLWRRSFCCNWAITKSLPGSCWGMSRKRLIMPRAG